MRRRIGDVLCRVGERTAELGVRAASAGRYRTAIAAFDLTIRTVAGRANGEQDLAQARIGLERAATQLGVERCNAEKYSSAVPLLERALALNQANAVEGLEPEVDLADILMILGVSLRRSARHHRAIHCFAHELDIRREEGDQEGEMNALSNLGHCNESIAEQDGIAEAAEAAARCFEGELALASELGDIEAQAEAYSGIVSCSVLPRKHDDETVALIEQAIEFWRGPGAGLEEAVHHLTRACIRLGNCRADRGETSQALAPLHAAVVSSRSLPPCNCRELALQRITDALAALDDPVAVEPYLHEALNHARAIGSSNEIVYMVRLGFARADQGDLRAGLQLMEESVLRAEEMVAADPACEGYLGDALASLAGLYNNKFSHYAPAIEPLERSIEIGRRLASDGLGGRLIDFAIVHENIGSGEHLQEAKALLEEALEVCARDENSVDVARAHYQLGLVHTWQRRTDEAVFHLEAAADLYRSLGDYRSLSETLSALAAVPGVPTLRAISALTESTSISRQLRDLSAEAHALHRLSRIRRANGLTEAAAESHRRGVEIVESVRATLAGPAERGSLLDAHALLYADAAYLANAQHEPRRAFEYAEAGRARLTLDQRIAEVEGDDLDPELSRRRRELAAEIGGHARRLEALGHQALAAGAADPDGDTAAPDPELALLERELAQLEAEWRGLEKALAAGAPRFAARTHAGLDSVWGVSVVQEQLLGDDDALLEYVIGDEGCLLFCITRDRFMVFELGLDATELERQVSELCSALTRRDGWYPHGHTLYRSLLAPAGQLLAGKRRVLICPDGVLHRLPFGVLLTEDCSYGDDDEPIFANHWRDLPYFLDGSIEIRYIASATTEGMLLQAQRLESVAYRHELLALAAPLESAENADEVSFEPLRFAREELAGVSSSFDTGSVRAIPAAADDPPADVAAAVSMLDAGPSAYRLVHLATHALIDDRNPWLSALVFDPEAGAMTLSYLHANEILDLRLSSQCVTMSGCQTRGDIVSAGEGMVGLALAFRYAGAQSVCAASWEVADRVTTELMQTFYAQLGDGVSPARALAVAQRSITNAGYHPFYWSGFGIYG